MLRKNLVESGGQYKEKAEGVENKAPFCASEVPP